MLYKITLDGKVLTPMEFLKTEDSTQLLKKGLLDYSGDKEAMKSALGGVGDYVFKCIITENGEEITPQEYSETQEYNLAVAAELNQTTYDELITQLREDGWDI